MAEGTPKELAVESIHEGRRLLEQEAAYLKVQLSPSHVAATLWDRHHRAIILLTLAAGIAIPQLLHKRRPSSGTNRERGTAHDEHQDPYIIYREKNPPPPLLSSLLKLATPFVVKEGLKALSRYMPQQQARSPYDPPAPVGGDIGNDASVAVPS